MAHYVQIPKDLNDIKQKFMFGLTKRQVVSFGIFVIMIGQRENIMALQDIYFGRNRYGYKRI